MKKSLHNNPLQLLNLNMHLLNRPLQFPLNLFPNLPLLQLLQCLYLLSGKQDTIIRAEFSILTTKPGICYLLSHNISDLPLSNTHLLLSNMFKLFQSPVLNYHQVLSLFYYLFIVLGWEARVDNLGRTFYIDHNTKSTTYTPPNFNPNPSYQSPPPQHPNANYNYGNK